MSLWYFNFLGPVQFADSKTELEHNTKDGQLYARHGHDHHRLHLVSHA